MEIDLNSSMHGNTIMFEFLTFQIQNFQTITDGETTKTKTIDLEKL